MQRDSERQRLEDDLRGLVSGDVLCSHIDTQLYASDASVYQIRPLAVVRPRNAADISATVQYARDNDLSIHARGSGSGVAGESIGPGVVLDCSKYLRRIVPSEDGGRVTVQAGATLMNVNRTLSGYRRKFGPDPATRAVTTMGGVIAVNASGSHYLRSGSARDTVMSARIVTANGHLVHLGQEAVASEEASRGRTASDSQDTDELDDWQNPSGFTMRTAKGLLAIREQFLQASGPSPFRSPASNGYRLDDLTDDAGRVDLARFYAGTQGTLAVLVDATVRTEPMASHRGVALLFFHRLDSALRVALKAIEQGLIACDVMDRRLLRIASETDPRFAKVIPAEAEAAMLVEIQGEVLGDLGDRLSFLRRSSSSGTDGAFESTATTDPRTRDLYWGLFRRVIPRQYQMRGVKVPLPFMEDLYVPPERLPEMLVAAQNVLKRFRVTATVFSHIGHGQLHIRPLLDLGNQEDRARIADLSEAIAVEAWQLGGQIGVEHAAGLSRSGFMPRQFGDYWQAMGQVKRLFDPYHRFNPGKLFGAVLQKPDENLRPMNQSIEIVSAGRSVLPSTKPPSDPEVSVPRPRPHLPPPQMEVLQQWSGNAPITRASRECNGCARCRSDSKDERQCPMFRITGSEEASPRAKANLLRGVLSGKLTVAELTGERAKEIADLCFNCHSCRVECPASVDIPKIVGELKAQYVATNGLSLSDFLLGRIDSIAAVGSRVAWLANLAIQNAFARWLAEKLFGLAAARQLPSVTPKTFVRHAVARRWHLDSPVGGLKVVYFVDHFANYHDPDIGRALAEILLHNQIGLYVPQGQSNSGMARITAGDLRGARKIARHNIRILADAVRQGYSVIATEPAAALCLKTEYPNLLDNEDAHLVAEHSHEACEYLWTLHEGGRLATDFERFEASMVYHQPCHSRVLNQQPLAARLLALVPGVDVKVIAKGCSGMAGTWGLQRKNYRNSLRIGRPAISEIRKNDLMMPTTECSACALQLQHGIKRPLIHPLRVLAAAYGRMPMPTEKEVALPTRLTTAT
ncbi:MAG: FAD-linked oxidase C-terminal domain-containing protein [Planctomycetota bacterium]